MALNTPDLPTTSGAAFGATPAPTPAAPAAPPMQSNQFNTTVNQVPLGQGSSWEGFAANWQSPAMMGPGSDMLAFIRKTMDDKFKPVNEHASSAANGKFFTMALDRGQGLPVRYSGVALVLANDAVADRDKSGAPILRKVACVYAMMLVGSNPNTQLGMRRDQSNVDPVSIPCVPSEAFDDKYVAVVMQQTALNYPGYTINFAGGETVPEAFEWQKVEAIERLTINASMAVFTEMATILKRPDLNVEALKADGGITATASYGRATIESVTGEPMRSDFRIDLRTKPAQDKQGQNNTNSGSLNDIASAGRDLGAVYGFIEPVYVGSDNHSAGAFGMVDPRNMSRKFAARAVITHMENTTICTPASFMLNIYAATILADNARWKNIPWQQRGTGKGTGLNLGDVGALNIDANIRKGNAQYDPYALETPGPRVNTSGADFTPQQYEQYMDHVFRSGLMFAVDVPLASSSSWYMEIYRSVMVNDPSAVQALEASLNTLTNNLYGVCKEEQAAARGCPVAQLGPIFVVDNNLSFLGTWVDSNNTKRDLRDFDYLAVLNAVGDRPETLHLAREFSNTYLGNDTQIRRLAKRLEITNTLTGNTVNLTGHALRCTFSDWFIMAMATSLRRSGLELDAQNMGDINPQAAARPVASFAAQAMVNLSGTNSFSSGGALTSNSNSNSSNFHIRQYDAYGQGR